MERDWIEALRENIGKVLVGKEKTVDLVLTSLAVGGHVLLEDVPGTGKTMLAKSLARSLDTVFAQDSVYAGSFAFRCDGIKLFSSEKR